MVDRDLGRATIVYEDPDDGTVERTVENEHVAYFQDHWIVKTDEHGAGHDVIRRIPAQRVFYVERSVEAFEAEVRTLRDQVQSLADDLRRKVLGGRDDGDGGGDDGGPRQIEVGNERLDPGGDSGE